MGFCGIWCLWKLALLNRAPANLHQRERRRPAPARGLPPRAATAALEATGTVERVFPSSCREGTSITWNNSGLFVENVGLRHVWI